MVDQNRQWRVENEGSLARTWEKRLKPHQAPAPQRRRRRVLAPWAKTTGWISMIWAMALVPALLAGHVLMLSYHYDQLNQQYAALTRTNQSLVAAVASKESAGALTRDAAKLKVSLLQPRVEPGPTLVVKQPKPTGLIGQITAWMSGLSHATGSR